ncbi:MAG: nickel-dependent lactate racemase [Desulfobacterales bacterium]|nr:nickel-dependent lactate racemase [Desulfobacterales bacterium]
MALGTHRYMTDEEMQAKVGAGGLSAASGFSTTSGASLKTSWISARSSLRHPAAGEPGGGRRPTW